ncbi:hypothetical protein [Leptospirillum ferrooxidans]|uniref:Uncharacterized protein n=1 Tax=Leptospirillum ferrooxidans (strain C2-3) TaxID=1162668 RepID=I0INJ1_LEPFC|nr:hypothetical protein [Leptospirillum ferrooxidans]BAM06840.1 hypothetical protein LFE_1149 [Leptospirillum ferrooxidans C2-3]
MNPGKNDLFVLSQLQRLTDKESRHLFRTLSRLEGIVPDLSWVSSLENNDEHAEMLEAFISRFSRLQDTLGDKLLPVLLRVNLESTGTQLDNLQRAEKFGWIESVQGWIELRMLRNRLIHEYMESAEDLLEALQYAMKGGQVLFDTQIRMSLSVQKILNP